MIKLNPPHINVEETMPLVEEVLRSGILTQGPKVEEFEHLCAQMAGARYAVAVSNATVALELLLSKLGNPGDEVITTAFTFKATVNAILRAGRIPRLVDVDSNGLMNIEQILGSITDKTAAIVVVHLYGYPFDVQKLSLSTGIPIIEDASQAHGSMIYGSRVGALGHAGVFSFYGTKNVAAGEGGVITTNNAALDETLRRLRNHDRPGHIYGAYPTNARMGELQAAVAIPQLKKLDVITDARRSNALHLSQWVKPLQMGDKSRYHNFHLFTIEHDNPAGLQKYLKDKLVESQRYYAYPMESYFICDVPKYKLTNMYRLADRVLSLPVHPGVDKTDLDYIGKLVTEYGS